MFKIDENPMVDVTVSLPSHGQGKSAQATFVCRVLDELALPDAIEERFAMMIVDWRDVFDTAGNPLAFSAEMLPNLLRQPGFMGHFQQAYHHALLWGAEKNAEGSSASC